MLHYRGFRNTDPPAVAGIWRSRAEDSSLVQPVSVDLFEQLVFGRLHFDYAGLVLAMDDDRPVGFAHASFGPDATGNHLCTETGVTCLIVVRPDCDQAAVAAGLLDHCEAYLRRHGAKLLYGGGVWPVSPFYAGLYGGCETPGVLESDQVSCQLYPTRGYASVDRTLLFRQDASTFRPHMDRLQIQCRRRLLVQVIVDAPARSRWEASTVGDFEATRFELVPRGGGPKAAYAVVRAMEWGRAGRSGRIAGLVDLFVEPASRRQGLATHLIGELSRNLANQGVAFLEAQALQSNAALVQFYRKLGFQQVAEGVVYRKEA
jgi:GNAT superfamily N-acetyltransferase